MQKGLSNFFEQYISKESIFKNRNALQANFTPENIPHRDDQINKLAEILAPCLKNQKPSNLFLYGKTGTGKTLSAKYVAKEIQTAAKKANAKVTTNYINCKLKKVADTEYRLIAQLAREFGVNIPTTGLPTDEVYRIFFSVLDSKPNIHILILDEIDQLVKKVGDEILYNLTRINTELKNTQIVMIGISNDLLFLENLDPRIKSSLSEEEVFFPPYDALQLKEILKLRSLEAFQENKVRPGVIEKCAAYAAREHGDARRALELLRVAGEIAERNNEEELKISHLDVAERKIEKDKIQELLITQPKQHQLILYSIILMAIDKKTTQLFTGEIYETYKTLCSKTNHRPLTQRRISDILTELDMLGIINAKVISKGRYGRTREISIDKNKLLRFKNLLEKTI